MMIAVKVPEIDSFPTLTVSVAVPGLVTLTGAMMAVMLNPAMKATRETLPVNPWSDLTVTVEFLLVFPIGGAVMERELGLVDREKSGPVTFTITLVK